MKHLFSVIAILSLLLIAAACSKTSFIDSPDAQLSLSTDTLHFDTVFTTTGSITKSFKIFNPNDQKLRLSNVQLMGGNSSAYKINVDGTPGTSFSNIEIEANDSVYVFVSVTINPNSANLPFIVQDSILVNYNGNKRFMQLDAFGQNANFFRNRRITRDSTWNNNLPFVILGSVSVDSGATLTVSKGCKIYSHADAPFIVNGSLQVRGETAEQVVFTGDRLDPVYNELPASWPGIFFTPTSTNNVLNYAIIKNAYQGVISQLPPRTGNWKVTLNQCIIDNVYDAGILSVASSVKAVNCLVSNCGSNISIAAGGAYSFDHCTVATYSNFYISHKLPVLFLTNSDGVNTYPLTALFRNCIFYGEGGAVENEVLVDKKTTSSVFNVTFANVLYKNKDDQAQAAFTNSLKNVAPHFDSIDVSRRTFNFHLKPTSQANNAGVSTAVTGVVNDLEGNPRSPARQPDLGCYEN